MQIARPKPGTAPVRSGRGFLGADAVRLPRGRPPGNGRCDIPTGKGRSGAVVMMAGSKGERLWMRSRRSGVRWTGTLSL